MSLRRLSAAGTLLLLQILFCTHGNAAKAPDHRFKAVAFDYFVIFDPSSVVPAVEKEFPGKGPEFSKAWRDKQFEYSFLRSITSDHADFFRITGDSLDYTAEQMHLKLTTAARERLLDAYLNLKPWPDTVAALKKLKASGVQIIALSNFSPEMMRANAEHAGIADLFDELLSTEAAHTFKPDPHAYELGTAKLHLTRDEIVFAAFGGWDVYGAKRFGYPTVWVNRFRLPIEKLGTTPDRIAPNLDGLVDFVLASSSD